MGVKQTSIFNEEEIAILDEAANIIQKCCNFTDCDYCPFKSLCGRPHWQDSDFPTDFQRVIDLLEVQ